MFKSIHLSLLKIKYGGDSIGRDICIEIEVFSKLRKVCKRINFGETKEINQDVGRIETSEKSLRSDIFITVTEDDLLFNDHGSIKSNINIDTTSIGLQRFVFNVEVGENRSLLKRLFWGARKAVFEIELVAQVGEIERYIPDLEDGWLVTLNGRDEEISLPAYVKVNPKSVKDSREYFMPLEGAYRGELLSVKLQDDSSSYLISDIQHESMAQATYSISKKIFTLNKKQYKTVDYSEAPWKKGIYNIGIPDHPHGHNNRYTEAVRQKVWFPINFESERYLHAGARSLGCMTIIETARWMEIYNVLIKARKGDFKSVGVVKVTD